MGRMSVISNGRRAIPVQPVAAGPQEKQLYISGNLFATLVVIAMVDSVRREENWRKQNSLAHSTNAQ